MNLCEQCEPITVTNSLYSVELHKNHRILLLAQFNIIPTNWDIQKEFSPDDFCTIARCWNLGPLYGGILDILDCTRISAFGGLRPCFMGGDCGSSDEPCGVPEFARDAFFFVLITHATQPPRARGSFRPVLCRRPSMSSMYFLPVPRMSLSPLHSSVL